MFRVDPKTVTRWAKQGKLTYIYTLGGHRRYLEREVRALLRGAPRPQTERRPQTETSRTVSIESAGFEHTRMDASVTHGSFVLALRETDGVLVGVCRVDDTHNGSSIDTAAAAYAEAHRAVVVEAEAGEAR